MFERGSNLQISKAESICSEWIIILMSCSTDAWGNVITSLFLHVCHRKPEVSFISSVSLAFHSDLQCGVLAVTLVRMAGQWTDVFCRSTTFGSWIAHKAFSAFALRPAATLPYLCGICKCHRHPQVRSVYFGAPSEPWAEIHPVFLPPKSHLRPGALLRKLHSWVWLGPLTYQRLGTMVFTSHFRNMKFMTEW